MKSFDPRNQENVSKCTHYIAQQFETARLGPVDYIF